MREVGDTPDIEVDDAAVQFIQDHGGSLFVWLSDAGVEHETTKPRDGIVFEHLRTGGVSLFVDRAIQRPALWRIAYHSFPRPHVRALWNGAAFSPSGA